MKTQSKPRYAIVSDVTPNCGTIEHISTDPSELIDLWTDDTHRAVITPVGASVGDRIDIDWDEQSVDLANASEIGGRASLVCYSCGETVVPEEDRRGCGSHCPECNATL